MTEFESSTNKKWQSFLNLLVPDCRLITRHFYTARKALKSHHSSISLVLISPIIYENIKRYGNKVCFSAAEEEMALIYWRLHKICCWMKSIKCICVLWNWWDQGGLFWWSFVFRFLLQNSLSPFSGAIWQMALYGTHFIKIGRLKWLTIHTLYYIYTLFFVSINVFLKNLYYVSDRDRNTFNERKIVKWLKISFKTNETNLYYQNVHLQWLTIGLVSTVRDRLGQNVTIFDVFECANPTSSDQFYAAQHTYKKPSFVT